MKELRGNLLKAESSRIVNGGQALFVEDEWANRYKLESSQLYRLKYGWGVHVWYNAGHNCNFLEHLTVAEPIDTQTKRREQVVSCLKYMEKVVVSTEMPFPWLNDLVKARIYSGMENGYGSLPSAHHAHHAYLGGLAVHTSEVLEYSLNMAKTDNCTADLSVLVPAVIFHDQGKLWDYQVDEEFPMGRYTDHVKQMGHLCRSFSEWMRTVMAHDVPEEYGNKVGHVILAHHGRKDWGSPVEAASSEAFIIHFADMLSARATETEYVRET